MVPIWFGQFFTLICKLFYKSLNKKLHCAYCTSDQNVTFKSVVHSHFLCTNFYGAKRMVQFSICSILYLEATLTLILEIWHFVIEKG